MTAYLAPREFEAELGTELGLPFSRLDARLFVLEDRVPAHSWWAQNRWLDCAVAEFGSVREAAGILRSIQRNWAPYSFQYHRRTSLIEEALPHVSKKRKPYPFVVPDSPMGSFCLLDEHRMLYSARCSSPFANGEIEFEENKEAPPSRAYLKLWETFTRAGRSPGPGSTCVDAGATPGGWTWVLASGGAKVTAIDRAPLDERIARMPGVTFLKHSAFTLKPGDLGKTDWLFSDVICYPGKLYDWVMEWIESGLASNIVCTIKMQGACDWETLERFAKIPGGEIMHLYHNKHELTFTRFAAKRPACPQCP